MVNYTVITIFTLNIFISKEIWLLLDLKFLSPPSLLFVLSPFKFYQVFKEKIDLCVIKYSSAKNIMENIWHLLENVFPWDFKHMKILSQWNELRVRDVDETVLDTEWPDLGVFCDHMSNRVWSQTKQIWSLSLPLRRRRQYHNSGCPRLKWAQSVGTRSRARFASWNTDREKFSYKFY